MREYLQTIDRWIEGLKHIRAILEHFVPQQDSNPYRVLGVEPDDSMETIRAVFRLKAKLFHPDRGGSEEKFKRLKEAYETIKKEKSHAASTS